MFSSGIDLKHIGPYLGIVGRAGVLQRQSNFTQAQWVPLCLHVGIYFKASPMTAWVSSFKLETKAVLSFLGQMYPVTSHRSLCLHKRMMFPASQKQKTTDQMNTCKVL